MCICASRKSSKGFFFIVAASSVQKDRSCCVSHRTDRGARSITPGRVALATTKKVTKKERQEETRRQNQPSHKKRDTGKAVAFFPCVLLFLAHGKDAEGVAGSVRVSGCVRTQRNKITARPPKGGQKKVFFWGKIPTDIAKKCLQRHIFFLVGSLFLQVERRTRAPAFSSVQPTFL